MGKDLKGKELGKGIRQRSDTGKFEARFTNRFGNRIRLHANTLREVKRKLLKAQYEDENGIAGNGSTVTLEHWSNIWMEEYKTHIRHSTRKGYESSIKIINDSLGAKNIVDIRPLDVMKMINQLHDQGYAVSTIKGIKAIAYNLFSTAYENNLIPKNPVGNIRIQFENDEAELKSLTRVEEKLVLDAFSKSHYYNLFAFILQTGLRIGEGLGLRWSDINFDEKEMKVERDMVYTKVNGSYTMLMENAKTSSSIRSVPLTQIAIRLLESQKSKGLNKKFSQNMFDDMIFVSRSGKQCTDGNIRNILNHRVEYLNAHGSNLPHVSPHMLRHTFATRCLESGMNIKMVSKILGHKKIDTTADIYLHIHSDFASKEILKLEFDGWEQL